MATTTPDADLLSQLLETAERVGEARAAGASAQDAARAMRSERRNAQIAAEDLFSVPRRFLG